MDHDPERHSLSPDALQKIYETRVAPRLFRGTQSVEQPTAIILGGQPGSGKTPMQNHAAREFAASGGMVKIIGDDLRAYLPHYKSLQRADDKSAAFYTDRDSGRLVEKAIAEAAQRRVNVLVEGTMRNPETVAATLRQFRDAGFRTDARVLAVSPEMSSLGILQRYAAQKESRGIGRMTTTEAHQNALLGMLDTLDRLQDGRLADQLTIYRRGGEVIHSFDLIGPAHGSDPRARDLVERERSRPLSPQEARYKQQEIERLTPILQKHGIIPGRDGQRSADLAQSLDKVPTPFRRDDERDR
ncbi:MAG: zeta toxin family protein [Sphingobium limneticum]